MHRIKKPTARSVQKLFETVNFAFMWKKYLLVKKHRKVNFVILLRRFTSSNFPLFELEHTRAGKNLMTYINYEKWQSSLFCVFSLTNNLQITWWLKQSQKMAKFLIFRKKWYFLPQNFIILLTSLMYAIWPPFTSTFPHSTHLVIYTERKSFPWLLLQVLKSCTSHHFA